MCMHIPHTHLHTHMHIHTHIDEDHIQPIYHIQPISDCPHGPQLPATQIHTHTHSEPEIGPRCVAASQKSATHTHTHTHTHHQRPSATLPHAQARARERERTPTNTHRQCMCVQVLVDTSTGKRKLEMLPRRTTDTLVPEVRTGRSVRADSTLTPGLNKMCLMFVCGSPPRVSCTS